MAGLPLQRIDGKYEILEKMKEGGMGAIYRVRHRLLEEIRVIKVMRPQYVEDVELRARFLREARLAIQLRHPNVAHLYDFTVDDDGTAFIVMEHISGVTLEELLRKAGPPSLALGLEIARQSLRALSYLHVKGFVHRDISPDNLMLTADPEGGPQIKLLDLGIAKVLDTPADSGLTRAGSFLGKVRYSPPEQFGGEGSPPVDARSDLYAFAVMLYELLTGRYPIQGRDPSSIIAGHLLRPPLPFAETDPEGKLPEGLRQALLRALAKDPAERFPSAAEMAREIGLVRPPGEVDAAELDRALSNAPAAVAGVAAVAPPQERRGTTQERLDQNFDLARTPGPPPLAGVAADPGSTAVTAPPAPPETPASPEPVAAPAPRAPLAAALAAVEGHIGAGDFREAEALLYAAQAEHGNQPAFAPLHERLARLHREARPAPAAPSIPPPLSAEELLATALAALADNGTADLAAARDAIRRAGESAAGDAVLLARIDEAEEEIDRLARQRRRREQLAAAVAQLDELLASGNLTAAGLALDAAVLRVGAAPALRERWQRLEQLRTVPTPLR
jgi:tRNA A-37 threonylcarbamoyl transferase component Bud32